MSSQDDNGGGADNEKDPNKSDYEVGYCKPPKEHQFKPNHRSKGGRPKGAKSLNTILKIAMNEKLVVKVGGKPTKMSNQEALVKGMIVDGLNGDHRSRAKILDMASRLDDEGDLNASKKLAEEDAIIMAAFLARSTDEEASDD